jgi:hypothetical protein
MAHSIATLPAELLVQIMCSGLDIKAVLSLTSTNRWARQVWHDHTIVIACAVFSFTRVELMSFLGLSKFEAWPPELVAQKSIKHEAAPGPTMDHLTQGPASIPRQQEPIGNADLNADVRQHLSWIERYVFGARVVQEISLKDRADTIEAIRRFHDRKEHGPERFEDHAYVQSSSNYVSLFLLLRRLVVGYDHPSILPSVYADLHDLSWNDMDEAFDIARRIEEKCEEHWNHMGIQRTEGERPQWSYYYASCDDPKTYLPRCWSFALHIMENESTWRPELPNVLTGPKEEDGVVIAYYLTCKHFGEDRIKLMFGSDAIPWTEERRLARGYRFWTADDQARAGEANSPTR